MKGTTQIIGGILIIGLITVNIFQYNNFQRLSFLRQCADERNRINDDQLKENLMSMINDVRDQNIFNAKNQGKIEGMIAVINNMKLDESNEYNAIWHSGYYAGTNTAEQQVASAYAEGYHKATEDGHCTANNKDKAFIEKLTPVINKKDETNKDETKKSEIKIEEKK